MEKGYVLMSLDERKRLAVCDRVKENQLSLCCAAQQLGLSYRQTRRVVKRYREHGAAGLVHKSRGRLSSRARSDEFKHNVLRLYEDHYNGFGPTLAAEKLFERHEIVIDHETLRRWLLKAGLWEKKRKRSKHRSWRKPKEHFGQMVQMDGSFHKWFGDNEKQACLIVMIDDATKTRLAVMDKEETVAACMKTLKLWIQRYGVPESLYTDRKNIYITDREPTIEEQLAGIEPKTVFGKACAKLGIQIIPAFSPQAKGRVERTNGIYQDRFVKELKLEGVATIAGANKLLSGGFNDSHNRKFCVEPASTQDFHRPLPADVNLANVLCFEHTRVVQNDWTIRYANQVFQIRATNRPLPRPRQRIVVRCHLDHSISLWNGTTQLKYKQISGTHHQAVKPHKPHRGSVAAGAAHRTSV